MLFRICIGNAQIIGQPVCRLVGRAGKATLKQLANRQGMAVTMGFLKPMADFINVSFKLEAKPLRQVL